MEVVAEMWILACPRQKGLPTKGAGGAGSQFGPGDRSDKGETWLEVVAEMRILTCP
jgi:hypothetical protein